jgi:large subunit ribosomal protein L21
VAPGDRILVDRVAAEPGSELTLDRVLMLADGDDFKAGAAALSGVTAVARVVRHERGPKIDVLRFKSKKRVRVHRGARAELSALEILEIGGKGRPDAAEPKTAEPQAERRTTRRRTRQPAVAAEAKPEPQSEPAPKRARARKAGKPAGEAEEESGT